MLLSSSAQGSESASQGLQVRSGRGRWEKDGLWDVEVNAVRAENDVANAGVIERCFDDEGRGD